VDVYEREKERKKEREREREKEERVKMEVEFTSGNFTGTLFSILHISSPALFPALAKAGSILFSSQILISLLLAKKLSSL
jgi:hypothetical protein